MFKDIVRDQKIGRLQIADTFRCCWCDIEVKRVICCRSNLSSDFRYTHELYAGR